MCGISLKKRPVCAVCGKVIRDDFCLVLDNEDRMQSCICLDCRDSLERRMKRLSPIWTQMLMGQVDAMEQETPYEVYDVISSELAAACG